MCSCNLLQTIQRRYLVKPTQRRESPRSATKGVNLFTGACRERVFFFFFRIGRLAVLFMVHCSVLWHPYYLSELSWGDMHLMHRKQEPKRRLYVSRRGLLNIDALSEQTFRMQFRFEKADFSHTGERSGFASKRAKRPGGARISPRSTVHVPAKVSLPKPLVRSPRALLQELLSDFHHHKQVDVLR